MPDYFNYHLLRQGDCLYCPDGRHRKGEAGDPTITFVYPEHRNKNLEYVLVDPGLSPYARYREEEVKQIFRDLLDKIRQSQMDFSLVKIFVTHPHIDHCSLVADFEKLGSKRIHPEKDLLPGLEILPTPGHYSQHYSLAFPSRHGKVIVAGDAVINSEYFQENAFYWPNNYNYEQAKQTLETMAKIKDLADIIIPGHGAPFRPCEVPQKRSIDYLRREDFPEKPPLIRVFY